MNCRGSGSIGLDGVVGIISALLLFGSPINYWAILLGASER